MARLITYYQRERIIRFFSITLMIIFLIVNLFPIIWMVFCSFKNNNDILSGNVGFSRVNTSVYSFLKKNNNLYIFSVDGSVANYNMQTHKIVKQLTIKGQSVNYSADDKFFYLTNVNNGIFKVTQDLHKIVKKAGMPIKGVDTNKFGNTSIINDDKYLYFTAELKGIKKIFVYDKKNLKLQKTIQLDLADSDFIRSLNLIDGYIYIGTNLGLLKMDKNTQKVVANVSFGEDYYPSGVQKILAIKGNNLIILLQNNVLFLDMQKQEIIKKRNYTLMRFEDGLILDNKLYLASAAGLAVVNLDNDAIVKQYKGLFKELKDGVLIDPKSNYTANELNTIYKNNDEFVLGSSYGRLSFMKENADDPYLDLQLPPGYRLVKWQNYSDLWKNIDFGLYLKNSVIISGFTMFFAMILATLASYALVRYNFKGNNEFGIAILSTQMIPQIMYLIPLFIMFKWVTDVTGIPIKGTYAGLIFIYTAFFVPFSIWILRSFFASIPVELEEAARIDGCNGFQVFYKIALPLAIPGIIATGIYVFLTAWDELMFAWVLTNADTLTIPIGIRLFVGNFQNRYDLMMAAATVATLPVLFLFFMLQKHIVKGLTAGAVKG
ncbi:MAG: ABC transporter permease subunit [Candidatus Margulisbacteria bacterium]|nr:ABC transporter permease subunit [Candidatus Margulisiibacteriota bacterium]